MMREISTLTGTIANTDNEIRMILIAMRLNFSLCSHTVPIRIRQQIGIRNLKAATAVTVVRYFSRNSAQTTIIAYPLRSASFCASGVPASPGIILTAVEAAIAAAEISMTVVRFSSR